MSLVPYDPSWHEAFVTEAVILRMAAGEHIRELLHFGSTAIPGASAKPIIDIAAVVPELVLHSSSVQSLQAIGYGLDWIHVFPDRICLTKGAPVTHHLYLVTADSPTLNAWIFFRDALRASPDLRAEYESLKAALATLHPANRLAYTEGKTHFVRRVMELRS